MYMDDMKPFAQNENELETLIEAVRIYNHDLGMEFGIENAPCSETTLDGNVKQKTTLDGRNRTTKPRKNQKSRRKGNLQIFEDIGSRQRQTNGN